jgi:hypothetical protein
MRGWVVVYGLKIRPWMLGFESRRHRRFFLFTRVSNKHYINAETEYNFSITRYPNKHPGMRLMMVE